MNNIVNSVLELVQRFDVGDIAKVAKVHTASIFSCCCSVLLLDD
jgi:hypothetical protein